jgi:hypothetical protein
VEHGDEGNGSCSLQPLDRREEQTFALVRAHQRQHVHCDDQGDGETQYPAVPDILMFARATLLYDTWLRDPT